MMTPLREALMGRRALVTGHTGFKGAWLSAWLTRLGAHVTGYSLEPPTSPSLFDALQLADRVDHLIGDVRDGAALAAVMAQARPDVVFHLAAQALVRRSYREPAETFASNIMGTVNTLEAVRACPTVRAVVVVSSDKCYANSGDGRAFRESDPLGGDDPYSASKGGAELVTAAYRASFFGTDGPLVASVRAGNVIGGGDWAEDRIVPDAVRALIAGAPVVVRNPGAVRPWQHVLSPLSGYLALATRLLAGRRDAAESWNFGPVDSGADRTVRWVVEQFLESWGDGSWVAAANGGPQPPEASYLVLDSAKARANLRWAPVWDPGRAVAETARWYREYYRAPLRAASLVDDQIAAFEDDARAAGAAWPEPIQERPGD